MFVPNFEDKSDRRECVQLDSGDGLFGCVDLLLNFIAKTGVHCQDQASF